MKDGLFELLRKIEQKIGSDLLSVKKLIAKERKRPLTAAIFGQTGSGKTSLINAIFGTNFDVDDVKPCTKEPQAHKGHDSTGNPIIFWDLPGIGESVGADQAYLDLYARYATTCDVILWAFQADTRTITYDYSALETIIGRIGPEEQEKFLSRLSVVITKADAISHSPWIFARKGESVTIATSKETAVALGRKAEYFYDGLFGAHQADIVRRTFITSNPDVLVKLPNDFWIADSKAFLCHKGSFDYARYSELVVEHPSARDELSRIYEQSRAVCCSAKYAFNLNAVKAKLAQNSEGAAVLRFGRSVSKAGSNLAWSKVKALGLPVLFDRETNKVIFDVEAID
jgi:uncharacterized protein